MKLLRKVSLIIAYSVGLIIFLIGLHKLFINYQFNRAKKKVESIEHQREYDSVLLFYKDGGEPIYLVNPSYKKTIFFFEGFRTQSTAGMYKDWFATLHEEYKINIIVPVYGIQSSTFAFRNRDWSFYEDIRLGVQVYDAYTSILPAEHEVFVISQSFGALVNSAIAAKAKRKPDKLVYLSPLNNGMEYKVAGPIVYWLSTQTHWLRKVLLFTYPSPPPNRETVWDIVNAERNIAMASKTEINPEDSSELGYKSQKAAEWLEEHLIPQIKNYNIMVVWGDSDLYFSQKGFENFCDMLGHDNYVEKITLLNSGHMVLLDNQESYLKDKIYKFLQIHK